MALDLEPAITEIRTLVKATWPEVTGVLDAEHVSLIPWGDLTLPFAVILITEMQGQGGTWGTNRLSFEARVEIFYVAETTGKAISLRGKLMSMANALWPDDPLTEAQTLDINRISWSDDLMANQILRSANRSQRAGVVEAAVLISIGNS